MHNAHGFTMERLEGRRVRARKPLGTGGSILGCIHKECHTSVPIVVVHVQESIKCSEMIGL